MAAWRRAWTRRAARSCGANVCRASIRRRRCWWGSSYFCSHEGRTTIVAATDEFKKLAENDLDGKLMASPAVADGDLILRTDTHLYRIAAE